MYCTSCGANLNFSASYCERCGNPSTTGPAASGPGPAKSRLAEHLRWLGILWIALSALHLIPGLLLLLVVSAFGGAILTAIFGPAVPAILLAGLPILAVIGILLSACSIAGIIAGWGLLERKPWARTLALILGVVNLPNPPFGTALGIYTLWVLLPAEAEYGEQAPPIVAPAPVV